MSVFVTCYFPAAVQALCGLPLGAGVFKPLPIMWLHLMIWKLDEVKKAFSCIVAHSHCCQIYAVVVAWVPLRIRLCVYSEGYLQWSLYNAVINLRQPVFPDPQIVLIHSASCSMWPLPYSRHIGRSQK